MLQQLKLAAAHHGLASCPDLLLEPLNPETAGKHAGTEGAG